MHKAYNLQIKIYFDVFIKS